jgi:hypothetical protein
MYRNNSFEQVCSTKEDIVAERKRISVFKTEEIRACLTHAEEKIGNSRRYRTQGINVGVTFYQKQKLIRRGARKKVRVWN